MEPGLTARTATAPALPLRPGSAALAGNDGLLGSAHAGWSTCATGPMARQRVAQGQALFHEGSAARCIHVVQAGDFKILRTEEDGYEQVLDFAGRGDLIGLDALAEGHHACTAVALEDASVIAIPLADLETLRRTDAAFEARLRAAMGRQFSRLAEMAWLMAAVGADRRTARFLLQMSRRMAEQGQSPRRLRLRMRRRDIASYLGLAHESVSRSLSLLAASGAVRVERRDVEILDHDALVSYARATRGQHEGGRRLGLRAALAAVQHASPAGRGRAAAEAPTRRVHLGHAEAVPA